MCDYSLMSVPNRLAREGEELVVYRFQTGSIGLAPPGDVDRIVGTKAAPKGFWARVQDFFCLPAPEAVCAVCIPPGARLELQGPENVEEVVFTQTSASTNSYRDAVQFANGRVLHLQGLREGRRVKVLDLSTSENLNRETVPQDTELLVH